MNFCNCPDCRTPNCLAGSSDELKLAKERNQIMTEALLKITALMPLPAGNGGWFYPVADGDGNEIGFQLADPNHVMGEMSGIAHEALTKP